MKRRAKKKARVMKNKVRNLGKKAARRMRRAAVAPKSVTTGVPRGASRSLWSSISAGAEQLKGHSIRDAMKAGGTATTQGVLLGSSPSDASRIIKQCKSKIRELVAQIKNPAGTTALAVRPKNAMTLSPLPVPPAEAVEPTMWEKLKGDRFLGALVLLNVVTGLANQWVQEHKQNRMEALALDMQLKSGKDVEDYLGEMILPSVAQEAELSKRAYLNLMSPGSGSIPSQVMPGAMGVPTGLTGGETMFGGSGGAMSLADLLSREADMGETGG